MPFIPTPYRQDRCWPCRGRALATVQRVVLAAVLPLAGCTEPSGAVDGGSDDAGSAAESMIDNTLWVVAPREDDPFYPEDDADVVPCPEAQYGAEVQGDEVWFSVETMRCNYLTVRQPLGVDVAEGAQLRVRLWHFRITMSEGTYTHVIAAGERPDTLWETELPVPTSSGGLLPFERVPVPRDLSAGEPIYWHLRNHGQNSWHLVEVSAH